MSESYIEWAEEISRKGNVPTNVVMMKLTRELVKEKDREKAKITVANKIINGGNRY